MSYKKMVSQVRGYLDECEQARVRAAKAEAEALGEYCPRYPAGAQLVLPKDLETIKCQACDSEYALIYKHRAGALMLADKTTVFTPGYCPICGTKREVEDGD